MARYQQHPATCGPASIRNALAVLGVDRSESEIIQLCRTTTNGTPSAAMLRALRSLRESCNLVGPSEISEAKPDVALLRLLEALRSGRPVICCVRTTDPWDHWALACGLLGSAGDHLRINCEDSGDHEITRHRTPADFLDWWRGPVNARRPFYGVVL